jgi:Phage portal protein, SPP1 Gp6-like
MMTQDELLTMMIQRLNEPAARYADLDRYYTGNQPLAFLSPEAKTALGNRFGLMSSNIPRLAVTALAERLRITGFSGDDDLWADWIRNDLDQTSGVAHREALLLGDSYVIVWADQFGRPKVTVESAKQVAVLTDPGSRQIVAAVKRWEDKQANVTHAVLYEPGEITRLVADQTGAVTGYRSSTRSPTRSASSPSSTCATPTASSATSAARRSTT